LGTGSNSADTDHALRDYSVVLGLRVADQAWRNITGRHRAATMATAYLISTGLTVSDALAAIQKIRAFPRPIRSQRAVLDYFSVDAPCTER